MIVEKGEGNRHTRRLRAAFARKVFRDRASAGRCLVCGQKHTENLCTHAPLGSCPLCGVFHDREITLGLCVDCQILKDERNCVP